jgi:hypothetical protein
VNEFSAQRQTIAGGKGGERRVELMRSLTDPRTPQQISEQSVFFLIPPSHREENAFWDGIYPVRRSIDLVSGDSFRAR